MEDKGTVEEFSDDIFSAPLEPLSDREIDALYGRDVRELGKLIGRVQARQRAADLVVSCVRNAGKVALDVVNAVRGVFTDFSGAMFSAPAYATRGIGPRPPSDPGGRVGPLRIEATKEGDGARIKVVIEDAAGRCDIRLLLEDPAGGRLSPLELYIEDREDGKVLLENTSYASGEAILRGVEPGEYWIEAESGGKSADMALRVEGAAQ